MLTIESIRNPNRQAGFAYVNVHPDSRRSKRYIARIGASGPHSWQGKWRATAEEAAQDYVDYINGKRETTAPAPAPIPVTPELAAVRGRHEAALAELDNRQSDIEEGFVYVVRNPAWPDYVKFGSAIDPVRRLNTYQTGTPLRDYKLERYRYTTRRRAVEKAILASLRIVDGEWVKLTVEQALLILDLHCPEATCPTKTSK